MRHLHVDIETFSSVDIKKGGLYKYVQAPDFQILLLAYSLDGSPVEVVDLAQGESLPEAVLTALFDPGVTKHAYNAAFEWYCLSRYFTLPDPAAWLSQWRCTMVHGLYLGYTAGLDVTGEVLGLPAEQLKSKTGAALIRTFSVPCKPTWANGFRTRVLPQHEPEKWRLFKEYCRQDVVTEMEIARRLAAFPMPEEEQRLWELDQSINARGVAVDMELVEGAIAVSEEVRRALMEEAARLTGLMKAEDYLQLPDMVTNDIPVVLDPAAKRLYDKLEREMLLQVDESTIDAGTAAVLSNKLLQLCNGAVYDENRNVVEIHNCKLEALCELLEQLNGQPALVFYNFRHDADRIEKALAGSNLRVRRLAGPADQQDWNERKIDVLLAHPASTAYGLNLQDGGNHVIWFGLNWSLELYQQANKRLHRMGQKQKVIVHHLSVVGGRDEDVAAALADKGATQDRLIESLKARIEKARASV